MARDHYASIPLRLIVRPYEDRYVAEISGVGIKAYDSSETGAVCCVLKGLHETIDREGFRTWSKRILSDHARRADRSARNRAGMCLPPKKREPVGENSPNDEVPF